MVSCSHSRHREKTLARAHTQRYLDTDGTAFTVHEAVAGSGDWLMRPESRIANARYMSARLTVEPNGARDARIRIRYFAFVPADAGTMPLKRDAQHSATAGNVREALARAAATLTGPRVIPASTLRAAMNAFVVDGDLV